MKNTKKIRVGIIGAGGNTRRLHIPRLQSIEGVEIVVIANRSLESAKAAADPFGIQNVSDQWQNVVNDPTLDAICIGTWPYLHAPATMAALENGKHVLCEARMACDAREAHAMQQAAMAHPELTAQLVPAPFTLAVDDTVRDLVAQGAIGTLLAVEGAYVDGAFTDSAAPLTWRQDERLSGINALTLGIRYEALMRWVGPASRIMAVSRISVPYRNDEKGNAHKIQIPDHLDIIGDLDNGAAFNLRVSSVCGLSPRNEARLYGTEGTLVIEGAPATVSMARCGDSSFHTVAIPPVPADALPNGWRVEQEFIDAIRGMSPIKRTTFEDGVRYMEFTQAVHESALNQKSISLPLIPKTREG